MPLANYKMIAALAVKHGEHAEEPTWPHFATEHGLVGWAPTQGHIPSGVPYYRLLPGRTSWLARSTRAMIIGKGSLFLGRMTNLFDGVSFIIQTNSGELAPKRGVSEEQVKGLIAKAMKEFAATLMADAE